MDHNQYWLHRFPEPFSRILFLREVNEIQRLYYYVFYYRFIHECCLYVYIGNYEIMNEICNYISFIAGIPALICIGKMYLDHTNEMYSYCSGLSYYFYIVHLPVVVLCQYFILLTGIGCIYNFVLSFVISVIITCGMCFTFCGGKIIFEVK